MNPVSTWWVSSAQIDPNRVCVAADAVVGLENRDVMAVPQMVGTNQAGHAGTDDRYAHVTSQGRGQRSVRSTVRRPAADDAAR